ncbi:hypothetical protein [Myceligenerans xiligouense]|uniref:Uncharacterized protein n=1 Tax=Myceligenerans xiligouense TaxID=253184 RepID=A0A3N4ZAM5_9MICO|nr:hypothetical protein [Myceligenerans xiligouense]RPF22918.1 hypothetical protein EDD34_3597 [Myceligenerans xiligouense]
MTEQDDAARFAVVSRVVVLVLGFVLAAVAVGAFLTGNTAWGIVLLVVVGLLAFARGMWTMRRGMKAVASAREKAQVPEAAVASMAAPTPVDRVVADLLGMNSDGLPYLIEASRTAHGARVEVRWKVEEVRWQTLFVKGRQAYAWRMEVDLDPATGHYKFVEYSGSASVQAAISPGGGFVQGNWTWKRGKTAGQQSATFVEGADGQVTTRSSLGTRTSWEGGVVLKPADAKVPVFTVLRNNGWRPRFDWFGARLFEK